MPYWIYSEAQFKEKSGPILFQLDDTTQGLKILQTRKKSRGLKVSFFEIESEICQGVAS